MTGKKGGRGGGGDGERGVAGTRACQGLIRRRQGGESAHALGEGKKTT